mmetsp:Transcript_43863/g.81926  ORF Transcript_43863/g.81926 Transcript_43863/m.81926 type:complete len:276 (-) Transcript_43863:175-1002(-)
MARSHTSDDEEAPESPPQTGRRASLQEVVNTRLLQRRNNVPPGNNLQTSMAKSVFTLKGKGGEEGSETESESDSSEDGDGYLESAQGDGHGPGQLLQALTSKWKSHTEKMVVQIIHAGAHVSERLAEPWDSGSTNFRHTIGAEPLHFAARLGLLEACSALLTMKAQVDAQTDTGVSALMVAVLFNRFDVANLLISAKASVLCQEANGLTVTDLAILEGHQQMVQVLLRREQQEDEETEQEVMQAAIDAGADISLLPPVDEALMLKAEDILVQLGR